MGLPTRAPRQSGTSGRALLLLGVLLALAAGGLVIYVVSQYTGGGGQTVTVVEAIQPIQVGKTLSTTATDSNHVVISQVFAPKSVDVSVAPPNYYPFTSMTALNSYLNGLQVTQAFYPGDILQTSGQSGLDPRLSKGVCASDSLTCLNGSALTNNVLILVQLNQPPALVAGDRVDILVTECNLTPGGGCITQTTLTDQLVYSVNGNSIYLAMSNQDAITLKYLIETGNVTFAIRPYSDTVGEGTPITTPVNSTYIVNKFGFK